MAAAFKLLPCPFCGGQARVRAEQKNRTYYIGCAKCGARSRVQWHIGFSAARMMIPGMNALGAVVKYLTSGIMTIPKCSAFALFAGL